MNDQLNHPVIFAIAEQPGKNLWFGGQENGITQYSYETGRFTYLNVDAKDHLKIRNNEVRSMLFDSSDNLWIGYISAGIECFNVKNGSKIQFKNNPKDEKSLSGNNVRTFYEGMNGDFWIGTSGNGLNLFNRDKKSFQHFQNDPQDSASISSNYINAIIQDSEGTYWVATRNGINVFRMQDKRTKENVKFKSIRNIKGDKKSLSNDYVISITEARNGDLWFGTMTGLNHLKSKEKSNPQFRRYFIKDGLPSDVVYAILEDKKGMLWLSTNKGISKFNPQTKTFINYNTSDGLINLEYNSEAAFKSSKGYFIFGGVNGVDMFNPDSFELSSFNPAVEITSFFVHQKPFSVNIGLFLKDDINLSYKDNYFSFEFSVLDYSNPEKIKYRYRLSGLDNDWIESNRNFANYTDVKPGVYEFIVNGTNGDGRWSKNSSHLNIVISPPFWATIWFRFLIILLFIGLFYGLHRYRVNNLLKLEKLRIKIASDLHDDIGANLTQIALRSDLMAQGIVQDDKQGYLHGIAEMSRQVVKSLSDLVWAIDSRNDTLEKLASRMKQLALDVFEPNNIDCVFTSKGFEKTAKLDVDIRQNLYLIFKEAVNNIVKHSGSDHVEIVLDNTNEKFRLEIKDNGNGFENTLDNPGNGLKNMKMRAVQLKANLNITATKKGVTILLERSRF